MNMKKTLAGLMAGVVAISAMATVAVSAKAQESREKTWSTSWSVKEKDKDTKAVVMIVVEPQAATDAVDEVPATPASATYEATDADDGDDLVITGEVDATTLDADVTCTYTQGDWDNDPADYGLTVTGQEEGDIIEITYTAAVAGTPAVEAKSYNAWSLGDKITLSAKNYNGTGFKITKILRIENRAEGSNDEITKDLGLYFRDLTPESKVIDLTGVPSNVKGAPLAIVCEVEADETIPVDAFTATFTAGANNPTSKVESTTNAVAEAEEKTVEKGVVLNDNKQDRIDGDVVYVRNLDEKIRLAAAPYVNDSKVAEKLAVSEPTAEMMDYLLDAKGATITFNFMTKDMKEADTTVTFDQWTDRYNWDASSMKSALSLRVNNSNVLSVSMKEFDSEKFAATFAWDEVMAKFQGGSYTGLVNTLGFKIDNSKLPILKDSDPDEHIELVLKSITIKVPELAETEDDTMVGDIVKDFAAGESATVVEDTLPAASDAPAATDAPATTDAAANPETGNSAAALLAIPAALAAAAIVAKKRG